MLNRSDRLICVGPTLPLAAFISSSSEIQENSSATPSQGEENISMVSSSEELPQVLSWSRLTAISICSLSSSVQCTGFFYSANEGGGFLTDQDECTGNRCAHGPALPLNSSSSGKGQPFTRRADRSKSHPRSLQSKPGFSASLALPLLDLAPLRGKDSRGPLRREIACLACP